MSEISENTPKKHFGGNFYVSSGQTKTNMKRMSGL